MPPGRESAARSRRGMSRYNAGNSMMNYKSLFYRAVAKSKVMLMDKRKVILVIYTDYSGMAIERSSI